MARRPGHEQEDDPLRLRLEVRRLRRQRIGRFGRGIAAPAEQVAQRQAAQADSALLEEPAAADLDRVAVAIEAILAVHGGPYSFVIVSSRFRSTRETTVHAAACVGVTPSGKAGGSSGFSAARSQGLASGPLKRSVSRWSKASRALDSASVGRRARQRRKANVRRGSSASPPSRSVLRARARADSRNSGS